MPADAAAELVGSLLLLGFDRAVDHVKADNGLHDELVKSFRDESARALGLDAVDIDALVSKRILARKLKKFADSDRIRDELKAMGIELEDHKDGTTTWKVVR
jgi:cysteinyl-tRNA synthetase